MGSRNIPNRYILTLCVIRKRKTNYKNGLENIKESNLFWDGSWRDIYVQNTESEDWEKWINLVNEKYRINWHNGKTNQSEAKIKFDVIKEYWEGNGELCSTANIFLDEIQINAHFFDDTEIENDIDPREFKSMDDHNRLIEYLKSVSMACNKEVIVTLENSPEYVLMKINGNEVQINEV